jgi:hypothetical protein
MSGNPGHPHFSLPLREVGLSAAVSTKPAWRLEQLLPNDIDKSRFALICRSNPLK